MKQLIFRLLSLSYLDTFVACYNPILQICDTSPSPLCAFLHFSLKLFAWFPIHTFWKKSKRHLNWGRVYFAFFLGFWKENFMGRKWLKSFLSVTKEITQKDLQQCDCSNIWSLDLSYDPFSSLSPAKSRTKSIVTLWKDHRLTEEPNLRRFWNVWGGIDWKPQERIQWEKKVGRGSFVRRNCWRNFGMKYQK